MANVPEPTLPRPTIPTLTSFIWTYYGKAQQRRLLARNHPEEDFISPGFELFFRLPVAHVEAVGNDAGPRFQIVQQFGAQLQVDRRQQIESYYGGIADFGFEQILLDELYQPGDARLLCVLARFPDSLRVDIDADSAGAEFLGRGYDDPAVAAAQVIHYVTLFHARGIQHRVYDDVRRRNVGHVRLAFLS